ncbi:vWA domain-containing protein [Niallia circulans]|uniref:vWA domain-containing protein n=1 Tax=Niallia circulans TaxID=1397 RepID=UPI001C654020|nr:VWA domain-containing protein [Niallia circulans]MCB5238668.1 VWA domain-containing protein [Niallia circulans]
MIKKVIHILSLLAIATTLAACSAEQQKKSNKKPDTEHEQEKESTKEAAGELTIDGPELPVTMEDALVYAKGEFGERGTKVEDGDVQAMLDSIPSYIDADNEDLNALIRYLYAQFKMEYSDPRSALKSQTVSGPEDEEQSAEVAKTFNVEIVLDASGSMANKLGGKTRMELAKESINKFAASLPAEANISLRVYGHKGTGSDQDKKTSCAANELVYSMQTYEKAELKKALDSFQPAGWTPLAQSLLEAQKDLAPYAGEQHQNIVYVVSDGIETCDGDPVAAAKRLKESGVSPVVNIIGFDVGGKDQTQLQEVAKAAGGTYANVTSQDQLKQEFDKAIQESLKWLEWKNNSTIDAHANKNEQTLNMLDMGNDWQNKLHEEKYLMHFSLNDLEFSGKITSEQNKFMMEKINDFYQKQLSDVDELKQVLIKAAKEDLDTTIKKIDEIYKNNTGE